MLFEVFNPEGTRVEWSENLKCVFNKETFQQRLKDGYTIKLNGKSMKKHDKLQEELASCD